MKKNFIMAFFGLTMAQADALNPQDINSLYDAATTIEADTQENLFGSIL